MITGKQRGLLEIFVYNLKNMKNDNLNCKDSERERDKKEGEVVEKRPSLRYNCWVYLVIFIVLLIFWICVLIKTQPGFVGRRNNLSQHCC